MIPLIQSALTGPISDERSRTIILEMLVKEKKWIEWMIKQIKIPGSIQDRQEDIVEWNIMLRECNEAIERVTNYKFE